MAHILGTFRTQGYTKAYYILIKEWVLKNEALKEQNLVEQLKRLI
jgi:hypothetical protein